jgi:hypothetical protein
MDAKQTLLNPDRIKACNDLAHWFKDVLVDNGFFRNCLNCEFWNKEKDECKKFKVRPPTEIIVTGCK